jgi:hypothetical protein
MRQVGDSVTASSQADDGYIGGKATAYNIWGNVLASVMDVSSSHTLAFGRSARQALCG